MDTARCSLVPEFVPIWCLAMIRHRFALVAITVLTVIVVGGLLLMHGLDTHGSQMHPAPVDEVSPVDGHGGHGTNHHDGQCDGCMAGAVMATCVAVITAVVSLSLVRRVMGARSLTPSMPSGLARLRRAVDLFMPPDPAWIRLSVMRC